MLKPASFDYLIVSLILSLSIALFCLALPRLRASFNHLPVDAAISKLDKKQILNHKELTALIVIAKKSIELHENPKYWADLSTLQLYQAQTQGLLRPASLALLQQTQYSIEQSLIRSPANSLLWYKLAAISSLLHAPTEKTTKALLLSVMTGPYELGHLLPRLNLCLLLFSNFNHNDKDLLRSQVLIAWEASNELFLHTTLSNDKNRDKVRLLLKDGYPYILSAMVKAVEKTH
jgi:hypothetical protein